MPKPFFALFRLNNRLFFLVGLLFIATIWFSLQLTRAAATNPAPADSSGVNAYQFPTDTPSPTEVPTGTSTAPAISELIDSNAGGASSLKLDSSKIPIIAYYGENSLKLSRCNAEWNCDAPVIKTVDNTADVGQYVSLALDTGNIPVIAYYDVTNGDLKLARCADAVCTSAAITVIDSIGDVGQGVSLALASGGIPVISYYDATNDDLKLARCNNTTCDAPTLRVARDIGGQNTSLALDSSENAFITFFSASVGRGHLVRCDTSVCSLLNTVGSIDEWGIYSSVRLSGDDLPVFSYSADWFLGYERCFEPTCADPPYFFMAADLTFGVGYYNSLALDVGDLPVISYYDWERGDLRLSRCHNLSCESATVSLLRFQGDVGLYTSLALNNGEPIISYYDNTQGDLLLYIPDEPLSPTPTFTNTVPSPTSTPTFITATPTPTVTYTRTPTSLSSPSGTATPAYPGPGTSTIIDFGGLNTSLKLDQTNIPVIAYLSNGELKLARCTEKNCATHLIRTLDMTQQQERHVSLAISPAQRPIVSYFYTPYQELRLAMCDDPLCTTHQIIRVDSTANVGLYSSLVLDSSGLPVIAYHDLTNTSLKLARCNNTACDAPVIRTLDNAGNVGHRIVMVLDTGNIPLIVYHDDDAGNLKFLRCDTPACESPFITSLAPNPAGSSFSDYPSLALTSGGIPVFTYVSEELDLRLAVCLNPNCQGDAVSPGFNWVVLDDGFQMGYHNSLQLKEGNIPVVSYFDATDHDLELVWCDTLACAVPQYLTLAAGQDGEWNSLALRGSLPVISYRNAQNNRLMLYTALWGGIPPTWTPTPSNTPVTPTSPPNATPARNYYTTSEVELTWTRVSWAVGYQIQIDDALDFATPLYTAEMSAQELSYTTPPLSNGTYYWRVCAKIDDTTCGQWSITESFIVSA